MLQAALMAWQVSPVQNSDMVLYCRLMRLKKVVAVEDVEGSTLGGIGSEPNILVYRPNLEGFPPSRTLLEFVIAEPDFRHVQNVCDTSAPKHMTEERS